MLNKSVARRYAEAFFAIAQEKDQIDKLQQELELVVDTIEEVDNFKEYLNHLLVPAKEKKEIIVKIFGEKLSQLTLNFLFVIIEKRREAYIGLIAEEFKNMADESRNIAKAELIAAKEISDDEIKVLADKLSASTGKTVRLRQTVDPALIGGIKIRIGDRVIDGTVAKKLEILRERLRQVKIS